ncbi:hypothetical protein M0R45_036800 [Rubus argutus]|uniref:TIR domain-containing protein n=1 Tax=Rubus argutus TaxID=59490 RepID=A0AAW1W0F3_RUBAR
MALARAQKSYLSKTSPEFTNDVFLSCRDYTSSTWCLDELVMILERKSTSDHVVLPVFYDVEPSDVRKQAENLANVAKYQENQSTEKLNGWRAALREAADLAGLVLRNEADGHEAKFIQNIVGVIQDKLGRRVPLSVGLFLGSTSEGRINNINWGNQGDVVTGVGGDFIRHVHGNIIKDAHIEVPRVVGVFQDKLGRPVPLSVVQEILQKKLLYFNSVVDDAEGKQLHSTTVKAWLNDLKEAVYDADDLLQEIKTEALRQEMEPESAGSSTSKVQELVSRPPSHAFDSALIITEAEKVLERLEDIVKQKEQYLGLEASTGDKRLRQATTRETSSLVDDSGVYGRDQDKEAIVKLLLSNDDAAGKEISVIPIIGMGGMGKTTLAQLVYNDIRVKQHFELQAWVCISDVEFDVTRITQTIYESVTGNTYCGIAKLDLLQNKLKGELMMKRFLLVLDDVWNENYMEWDKLRQPFESGAFGSKIIVTARNQRVASAMCALPSHHLMQLSDEDCWLLFARHAFGNADLLNYPHRDLASIGRQIATKCKGLPLAAKSLGGLLRSELNVEEWVEILESDIWELSEKKTNILPALWLSYHYLPSHLKRCFAHCAIFPKDYYFTKSEMVLLWMAEDLLQSEKKKIIEQVGDDYFNDLISRSFFQSKPTQEHDPLGESESLFTMHDLINDLAKFVLGEFCFRLEDHNSSDIVSKIRHFSYMKRKVGTDGCPNFDALCKAKSLHTFVAFAKHYISSSDLGLASNVLGLLKLKWLRFLDLSHYDVRELPDSIGNFEASKLHIEGAKVESVGVEFYGCGVKPFRSLNELSFVDMLEWQEWFCDVDEEGEIFPNLCDLTLQRCPKLTKMLPSDKFPKLESLQLRNAHCCPEFKSFPKSGLAPSLVTLILDGNEKLLANGRQCGLQRLNSLLTLMISNIEELSVFPEEGLLPTSLTHLSIFGCPNLTTLDGKGLRNLDSLQSLSILNCPQLQCLPEEGLPTSLSTLFFYNCPFLERRLQRGKGEDWPKIAHIPNVVINNKKI